MEVGVSLIQLYSGELRVVLGVHALVAEDTTDLIDPVHPPHNQPLQGQFGGDTHVHVDIQGVVVGDKGPGGSAAGDGIEDRGLHLNIAHVVQIVPHELNEPGPDDEVALHLRIDNQVHIPLAIAQFGAGQTVELLRQGQQGLGQQGNLYHPDRHLPPLGAENHAVNPYNVADIVLFKAIILRLIHLVLPCVELDAARFVL